MLGPQGVTSRLATHTLWRNRGPAWAALIFIGLLRSRFEISISLGYARQIRIQTNIVKLLTCHV